MKTSEYIKHKTWYKVLRILAYILLVLAFWGGMDGVAPRGGIIIGFASFIYVGFLLVIFRQILIFFVSLFRKKDEEDLPSLPEK